MNKTKPLARPLSRLARRRMATLKEKSVKTAVRGLSFGISLMLVLQCLAFNMPVSAQDKASDKEAQEQKDKKGKKAEAKTTRLILPGRGVSAAPARGVVVREEPELVQPSKGKTVVAPPPVAQETLRRIEPENRLLIDMQPVNMEALSKRKTFAPQQSGTVELKAIHPPNARPEVGRRGVRITRVGTTTIGKPTGKQKTPAAGASLSQKLGKKETPDEFQEPLSPIPTIPSPAVTRTFKSDNLSIGFIPPDTMGAVGPNHVVTTTNEKVVIHDRNGVILSIVTLDDFWDDLPNGLADPATFDPKILYDRFNDRFIFCVTANAFDPTSATLFAVSQTGNPLGMWSRYAIDADATANAMGGAWADYPSIGFNKNWIVISINRFGFGNRSGFQGPSIYVINKAAAYAGSPSIVSVFEGPFTTCLEGTPDDQFDEISCGFTFVPAITEDNTTEVEYITEDWDSGFGQLRMTRVEGPAAAPVIVVGYQFPQSPYSWRFNSALISGSGGYLPQRQQNVYAPSGNRPTANDSRIQNAVYRNGSFWTTHTVMLARTQTAAGFGVGGTANPDIRSGVQWWQINPAIVGTAAGTPPIQRNIIADPIADNCHNGVGGTRTTGSCISAATQRGDFYAYPNISVNANNDVLIGYSRFSPLTLPKAAYSFRAAGDPPNTFRDSMTFREGQGNYNIGAGSPFNIRWGDYSSTMVDPVNDTDFWTIQEYALDQREIFGPGGFAGLWSTWWALIKPSTSAGTYSFGNSLIISELRLRGPAGSRDEFVELLNPSNSPVTVFTTDGSDGWTLVYSSPGGTITPLATIPNGTVIPARGYYLITNEVRATGLAPYSMSSAPTGNPVRTADSDAMWTPDNADNGGFALFRTANQTNFNEGSRMDAVGFAALAAGSLYKEGAGLPNCTGTANAQMSFTRKGGAAAPQDSNANENDFDYVSQNGAAQTLVCQPVLPGNPTPCNLDAPPGGAGCTGPPVMVSSLRGNARPSRQTVARLRLK